MNDTSVCELHPSGSTRRIVGYVYFDFICYLSIGLPLAVLPPYVHLRMGYSAMLAGLAISIQYIATLSSRPWSGRICDRAGAKVAVLRGMAIITISGIVLVAASLLHAMPILSMAVLLLSRLLLGVGQSLSAIGAILWGIGATGSENTTKVITLNGIATYGGMALGAPIGVALNQRWDLSSIGVVTTILCAISYLLARRKSPVTVRPGDHLPFLHVLGHIAPHGAALALGGVGYSVLATFITLFYASRHWGGAAFCLTVFGATFVLTRMFFHRMIDYYGGFQVTMVCLALESAAMVLLWRASAPWMAFVGAALTGFGFSLVYPALGTETVACISESNRGSALAVFSGFADVSFFLTGPIAGAVIGAFGYASVFVYALACVMAALGIVVMLRFAQKHASS